MWEHYVIGMKKGSDRLQSGSTYQPPGAPSFSLFVVLVTISMEDSYGGQRHPELYQFCRMTPHILP
jgi:hypothetical protein